jgi:hypothetical protein
MVDSIVLLTMPSRSSRSRRAASVVVLTPPTARASSLKPCGALEQRPDDVQHPLLLQQVDAVVHRAEAVIVRLHGRT